MKVYEILAEMSWPDKFYQIEQKLRSSNMTVGEFIDYMAKEYNFIVQPSISRDSRPMTMMGASITSGRITAKDLNPQTPPAIVKKVVGKKILNMEFGPGVEGDTPIKSIDNFFSILRHELSHSQQGDRIPRKILKQWQAKYISPDRDDPISPQAIQYVLQKTERAAQSVDLAQYLARIGFTPEQFEQCINLVGKDIASDTSIDLEEALNIAKKRMQEVGSLDDDKLDRLINNEMAESSLEMVIMTIVQMAIMRSVYMPVASRHDRRALRQIVHLYLKQIKKRYPKVKGYYMRHKEEDIKEFAKHSHIRAQIELAREINNRLIRALNG